MERLDEEPVTLFTRDEVLEDWRGDGGDYQEVEGEFPLAFGFAGAREYAEEDVERVERRHDVGYLEEGVVRVEGGGNEEKVDVAGEEDKCVEGLGQERDAW